MCLRTGQAHALPRLAAPPLSAGTQADPAALEGPLVNGFMNGLYGYKTSVQEDLGIFEQAEPSQG